jgi:tRNA G26 N,N-dimethylase Trm1
MRPGTVPACRTASYVSKTGRYSSKCCSTCEPFWLASFHTSKVVVTMEEKRKKKIPTYREWYEEHREQFERTERHYEQAKVRWAKEAAEREAAREGQATEDAA